MTETVLITEPEYRKAEPIFAGCDFADLRPAPSTEADLAREVRQSRARIVILGIERYACELYDALRPTGNQAGGLIARFGVGHDGVDKSLAAKRGLYVTNTPGVLDASVAEHALWLMGACARNLAELDRTVREGRFTPRTGTELAGTTLAVLGFGPIGRRVAKLAHHGLGMDVQAVDLLPKDELERTLEAPFDDIARAHGLKDYTADLDAALPGADVVSLHLPANEATQHLLNADRLASCKPGAILINTARGGLVDESALYDALQQGPLATAGLDVYENEPYRPVAAGKDLRVLPNVVLSPHVGSNTLQANRRMALRCLRNVRLFVAGKIQELDRVPTMGHARTTGDDS